MRWRRRLGCTVLLKGPTTVVADPTGEVLVVDHGDERLATAGTGDVLAGMIGACSPRSLTPLRGRGDRRVAARRRGSPRAAASGLVAGDLLDLLPGTIAAHDHRAATNGATDERRAAAGRGRRSISTRSRTTSRCCGPPSRPSAVWAVVKADGYGHGAVAVGRAALAAGAEGLCVALVVGGRRLARGRHRRTDPRAVASNRPTLARTIVEHRLTPTVYTRKLHRRAWSTPSPTDCPSISRSTPACSASVPIPHAVAALVASIQERSPAVELAGVFTHLAVADEPDDPFTATQLGAFRRRAHPRARRPRWSTSPTRPARWPIPRRGGRSCGRDRDVRDLAGPGVDDLAADLRPVMSLKARISLREAARSRQPDLVRAAVPVRTRHDRGDDSARVRRRGAAAAVVDDRPPGGSVLIRGRALPDRRHDHDGSADGRLRRPRRPRRRGSRADR